MVDIPPYEFVEAPGPDRSPLAYLERSETRVALGLPTCGTIEVTHDDITIKAPDRDCFEATRDRLGEWARAQWLGANGYRVMRGAAVSHRGKAVLLIGGLRGQRSGASVLALTLSRRGWGLISDGLIVLDASGVVHSLEPSVTLDIDATIGLPPEVSRMRLQTGRERTRVETVGHPDAEVGAYVFLLIRDALISHSLEQIEFSSVSQEDWDSYRIAPLLPSASYPPLLPTNEVWKLSRPYFSADMSASSPPALASILITALAGGRD